MHFQTLQYNNHSIWRTFLFSPELEGPVSLVSVSLDSLLVLACSSAGILGFLDVKSRSYNTLMRSHTDTVLGFSVDGIRRHLTTASSDGTVRVWSMDSLHQVSKHHIHNYVFYNLSFLISNSVTFHCLMYPVDSCMTLCLRTALAVWPSIPVSKSSPVVSSLVLSESLTSPAPNYWLNTSMCLKKAAAY